LRANHRELALRAWLYRVAHNRCIDELRRPAPPPPEVIQLLRAPVHDPIAEADQRESLRRLIADVRRLPDQQRSALLMRELGGMSYADLAAALGVTIPAVKSLLVRARLALGQALEARDTACSDIREELILAHDRGLRPGATARRHMRDCTGCREFRHQLRGVSRRFGAIVPTLGPLGVLANLLGVGGAGGSAAGGALAAGGAAGTSTAVVSVGALSAGAGHVATLLAAAVVTAGGAVELQQTLPAPVHHHHHHARVVRVAPVAPAASHRLTTPGVEAASPGPSAPSSPLVARTQSPAGVASGDSAKASRKPDSPASTLTSTTTITPVKVKVRATGGISTAAGNGGASPTAPSDSGTSAATGGPSTSPTLISTSSSAGTPSSAPGATSGSSTSTTPDGSTVTTQPGSASSTSTGSASPSTTTGTGSSTGTAPGGSPPPAQ
jgi:hypothetical protein